jgi:hypothetical protein
MREEHAVEISGREPHVRIGSSAKHWSWKYECELILLFAAGMWEQ